MSAKMICSLLAKLNFNFHNAFSMPTKQKHLLPIIGEYPSKKDLYFLD